MNQPFKEIARDLKKEVYFKIIKCNDYIGDLKMRDKTHYLVVYDDFGFLSAAEIVNLMSSRLIRELVAKKRGKVSFYSVLKEYMGWTKQIQTVVYTRPKKYPLAVTDYELIEQGYALNLSEL